MAKRIPVYKKLHQDLKQDILSGDISKGTLLPSENELSAKYNTTRATVRLGLQELVNEGFIEKRMGLGSVVLNNRRSLGLLSFKGFSEVLKSSSLSSTTVNLGPTEVSAWPSPFFYKLSEKEKKAGCFSLEKLRSVEGNPVMLEFTYVPKIGLNDFLQETKHGSLFHTLQNRYDIEVQQVIQDARSILVPEMAAHLLHLKSGDPVLHIYRKYLTNKDNFHIYSSLYCNTEKYAMSNFFS